ncbi:MAG: DUF1294 domain-containing protein [Lachnospiraceae bacterium]|nr:DUF1294 domain-containing protein [Lachnospiraceae bacterium]
MNIKFYQVFLVIYTILNIATFVLYGIDKKRAREEKWRIPEAVLLKSAFYGGAFGAGIGMLFFHHKTRKKEFQVKVPLFICLHIFLIIFCTWSNNHLVVTKYDLGKDSGVAGDFRIVQVSDLHNTYLWWQKGYVADMVAEQKPDMIVITGDMIDSRTTDKKTSIDTAKRLTSIADTYYVTGNHEERFSDEYLEEFFAELKEAGVRVLEDEYILVGEGDEEFALIGIRDKSLERMELPLKELIREAQKEAGSDIPTVVLSHEPQLIKTYAEADADLVLTGHAHGGQIRLPIIGGLVAPDQGLFPKYTSGLYTSGNTKMIVSRGVGNSAAPIRVFNDPEIVVVDL